MGGVGGSLAISYSHPWKVVNMTCWYGIRNVDPKQKTPSSRGGSTQAFLQLLELTGFLILINARVS